MVTSSLPRPNDQQENLLQLAAIPAMIRAVFQERVTMYEMYSKPRQSKVAHDGESIAPANLCAIEVVTP